MVSDASSNAREFGAGCRFTKGSSAAVPFRTAPEDRPNGAWLLDVATIERCATYTTGQGAVSNISLHRTPELAALTLAPVSSGRWAARRSVQSVCEKENPLEEKRW